ncbi:hypothetical protein SKTS_31250 [Sulfurimicrobium lacus]|uniref:Uncharacterized protein n=1 Tax=Sulfurimicrobium lacus TaxID=2715678 RepID=A0A6F8VHP8_9PROT|nr:DUF6441 family protein [Sulfurimicrobium lacus]BCB28239.1 hypothetical protein SKTS_31250 [Sulfurimicrobium lacus]
MLKLSLTASGLLDKSKLDAWSRQKQTAIHKAVAVGMRDGGKIVADGVRRKMKTDFTVKKAAFVNSLRAKVYDRNPDKLPAVLIGSKIPWLGIHMRGGTISGRMLIPLTEEGRRIGRRAFKRVIDTLIRSGNAYFIRKNGQAILMAENIKENASVLTRFKRAERSRTGAKSIKRGAEIPIAVLVPAVSMKRRFDLEGTVRGQMPVLARAIEKQLTKI